MESLTQRSVALRAELKAWERSFLAQHDRKAAKADIKADPAIAAKYTEYHKLQDSLKPKDPTTPSRRATTPTPQVYAEPGTPSRRLPRPERSTTHSAIERKEAAVSTPQKRKYEAFRGNTVTSDVTPQKIRTPVLFETPKAKFKKDRIGPTPQKNGIPISLFDTPPRAPLEPIQNTPSRTCNSDDYEFATPARGGRTPQSESKGRYLRMFMSPKKEGETGLGRYAALETVSEEFERALDPAPWKPKFSSKPLSKMIAELREQEEAQLEEDEAILREMEGGSPPKKAKKNPLVEMIKNTTMERSSELDAEGFVQPEEEQAETGAETQTRTWKKKGQKRTTRRVNMRPVVKAAPVVQPVDSEEEAEKEPEAVGAAEAVDDDTEAPETPAKKPKAIKRKAKPASNFRKLKIKNQNTKAKGKGRFRR
ncbi:hypothetical protein EJ06DRAFT_547551 [Trichodelitschia bisporula]|uniref:DNA replication regulator SLD2 n=1 Tax=Trichodelitschia bisporula TaxID=703511 RepID=A0A6G1I1J0_9PEZI|nr:hypothetical protein EJ06DRAFT_547551 [Trichodelitschia bisporula]